MCSFLQPVLPGKHWPVKETTGSGPFAAVVLLDVMLVSSCSESLRHCLSSFLVFHLLLLFSRSFKARGENKERKRKSFHPSPATLNTASALSVRGGAGGGEERPEGGEDIFSCLFQRQLQSEGAATVGWRDSDFMFFPPHFLPDGEKNTD